jgi:hypothetical protein
MAPSRICARSGRIEHAARGRQQRAVHRYDVARAQQLAQCHLARAPRAVHVALFEQWVAGQHSQPKARSSVASCVPVWPRPTMPTVRSPSSRGHQLGRDGARRTRRNAACDVRNALEQAEDHAQRVVLGDAARIAARLVAHDHAGFRAGVHIDRVVASAEARDQQQAAGTCCSNGARTFHARAGRSSPPILPAHGRSRAPPS